MIEIISSRNRQENLTWTQLLLETCTTKIY